MLRLLKILLLLFPLNHGDLTVLAHQTVLERVPKPSVLAAWNTSAASPLMPGSSSAHVTSFATGIYNSSYNATNPTPPMPTLYNQKSANNIQDIRSGFCAIGDDFCSFKESNGTITEATATNFSDQCLLWDPSCTGNRTLAIQKFFGIAFGDAQLDGDDLNGNGKLIDNDCFLQNGVVNSSDCNRYNPPERLSDFGKIKNWMRSQQCVTAADEWMAMTGNSWPTVFGGHIADLGIIAESADADDNPDSNSPSCCGTCNVWANNVDLYYWLEPDANLSCLSIIGKSSNLPLEYGATTTTDGRATEIYWGCTVTSTGTIEGEPGVSTTVTSVLTTAEITTIGSLSVKVSSISPWSSSPCLEDDAGSQPSNQSIMIRDKRASIYARELIVCAVFNHPGGRPATRRVLAKDNRSTSPSVYAYFHGLSIYDNCGQSVISPTMLSFSNGELSTIEGHLGYLQTDPFGTGQSTKQFDLGDLPCPPQSVMETNWYKPQPGEPYRPLIAMPSQLKHMNPLFSFCNGGLFTAYDPPSALNTETALAPPIPPSDPKAHPLAPVPSPTLDPGNKQKGGQEASIPVPANIPTVDQPQATKTAAPVPPKQEGDTPEPQPNDPVTQENSPSQARPNPVKPNSDPNGDNDPQGGSPPKQASDPNQGSDPKESNDPTQGSGSDMNSGQEADPKPNSDPNQVDSNQGFNQNADPVPQNDPKQTDDADPFKGFTEGQAKTINNQVIQPLSNGISIAGTTLTPGAPPITVSGTPIQLGSSALIIGTSTVPLTPYSPTQMITTIAGQAITAAPDSVAIAGKTLIPGAPGTTIDGTVLSLDTSGNFIAGSKTIPLESTVLETITSNIAGQVITAAPNGIAVAGITLRPGAPGMTLSGTLISLDTASQLIVGSKTIPLESASPNSIVTTIGGQVITAALNEIAIAGTDLALGAAGVMVGGTLISLNTAGQLIVRSKTITLPSGDTGLGGLIMGGLGVAASSEVTDPITTTIDGQIITAGPTALVIAGTTLTPGAPGFTIDGTVVSLNTAAHLVVGSKTIPLEEGAGSSGETAGLGGLILGAFGSGGPFEPFNTDLSTTTQGNSLTGAVNDTNANLQAFEGKAASLKGRPLWWKMAASVIAMSVLAYMC